MKAPLIVRREPALADGWSDAVHPVLRRVYAARGVRSPDEVDHRLGMLASPTSLGGLEAACEMLAGAIARDERVVVVGDFDCDGATGTAVAVRGLRLMGARRVGYRVPNRSVHGYGLTPALVDTLEDAELIVTVDNGVASVAGVERARLRGMRVLVTDHHLPGATLPAADAIVNPNLPGDAFPSKALAGVGVVFYLLLALRARLYPREAADGEGSPAPGGGYAVRGPRPDLAELLDLVAIGTVADLVPLDHNNRVLVEAGLRRIRSGRACLGVRALLQAAGRDPRRVVATDLGFAVAPRINAAGRLEDMAIGIECLLADDAQVAHELAGMLSSINEERRGLQAAMVEEADALVANWLREHGEAGLPHGVVLFDPGWHPGVVGLVASKLKERLHRPVVACAPAAAGSEEVRASARSIRGLHVRDVLAEVDALHPGLVTRFGGHAMAAGLSLACVDVARFAAAFDAVVRERAAPSSFDPVLLSDGELDCGDLCLALARELREAGPWGQGFPEPLFDNRFELVSWRLVGGRHWRLDVRMPGLDGPIEAILFEAEAGATPPSTFRAVYQLDVNDWNGRERLQLVLRHLQPEQDDGAVACGAH